jgi:CYTH domain-containing protein
VRSPVTVSDARVLHFAGAEAIAVAGTVVEVRDPLKYAVVERERRFLVSRIPDGVVEVRRITDRYLDATRLRLREVLEADGTMTRKLGQKIRLGADPGQIACTSVNLDDAEWKLLQALPARTLRKTRHIVERDGVRIAVDELEDGALLAEIDDGPNDPRPTPDWLEVIREVTTEERWTGGSLAR